MPRFVAGFSVILITGIAGFAYYLDIRKLARQDKLIVEILLLFLAVVLVVRTVLTFKELTAFLARRRAAGEQGEPFPSAFRRALHSKEVIFLAATASFIALFPHIGFFVSSFLYVLTANILLGTKGKFKLIAIPAGLTLVTYLLFVLVFQIRLPTGILI